VIAKVCRAGYALLWLGCSMLSVVARADVAVPPLTSPVTDLTHTLTPEQTGSLEQTLRAFEQRKGSQLAVLIVPTTQPETIEQYSIRVATTWKLGRKGVDDGALLVIAKDDRALRIESGYGVEGALSDVIASRIIREVITPQFRNGEFYAGIAAGVDRIIRTIDGEPLPPPNRRERNTLSNGNSGLGHALPILLVIAFVVGGVLRSIFGRLGGSLLAAGAAGFIGWLIVRVFALSAVFAVIAFFATLFGGGGRGWSNRSGGWGGGFGGGSGGWGGGGGGFGGGGASGRW
jgi:uncharacterized protein